MAKNMKEIKARNELTWDLTALQVEAAQLIREQKHLNSKAIERQLTIWEKTRMDEIVNEIALVFNSITSLVKTKQTFNSGFLHN